MLKIGYQSRCVLHGTVVSNSGCIFEIEGCTSLVCVVVWCVMDAQYLCKVGKVDTCNALHCICLQYFANLPPLFKQKLDLRMVLEQIKTK